MADDPLRVVELAERSDTGRVRDHNEDRSYASATLVAVADGMGGALAGEVAAQIAVDAMERVSAPQDALELQRAIEGANRTIRDMAGRDPAKTGMGTTMTAITVNEGHADVVHIGDSRAYLWREEQLRQLTHDHSVVAEMVRRGTLSAEEAEHHPHRNVITRALGADAEVQVDRERERLREGDVLLVCSDGLYGEVSDAEIADALRGAGSLRDAATGLVERANANGGSDNVTVVLARIGHGDPAEPLESNRPVDTAEFPVLNPDAPEPGTAIPGRATAVIGGVRSSQPEGAQPAQPARVLQPVETRRRAAPWLAAAVALIVLIGGGSAWAVSRLYSVERAKDGTLVVRQGVALGPFDTRSDWQPIGLPATAVSSARTSDIGNVGGQGATVYRAASILWADGIPDPPDLKAAPRHTGLGPASGVTK
ncbi:MAG: Stp1/IreP family PP2C-type Ser/Thr phosphatase [Thermoleophilia bacterium]